MMGLAAQVHYRRYKTDINAIEEIAVAAFIFGILISYAPKVNLAHMAFLQPVHGLLYLILVKIPEMREIIHHAIGYHAKHNAFADLFLYLHQAVDRIIERGVSPYNDYGLIAVVYHHHHKTLHTSGALALDKVELYFAAAENLLHALPTLARILEESLSRTI